MSGTIRHVTIRGRVQGVGYRMWTEHKAQALGLSGWVRNEPDGAVTALLSGSVEAVEGYAELSVPLLKDLPMMESLRFDGAIRYSDYKRFGSDVNYKAGLDWTVGYGLRARATWGTAFRVPNVAELFSGVTQGQLTTTDPCSRYATSTNATRATSLQRFSHA